MTERIKSRRPRGQQVWRDSATGELVRVLWRRTTNPMAGVRPHLNKDAWWSIVAWVAIDGETGAGTHEGDFVKRFEFVRAR